MTFRTGLIVRMVHLYDFEASEVEHFAHLCEICPEKYDDLLKQVVEEYERDPSQAKQTLFDYCL